MENNNTNSFFTEEEINYLNSLAIGGNIEKPSIMIMDMEYDGIQIDPELPF